MHQVIVDGLEDYLAGIDSMGPARREFDAHLKACAECRQQIEEMSEVSRLFTEFRSVEEIGPSLAFYSKVSRQIGVDRRASFWSLFTFDPTFGRRVVFASLMTLAVLGSYLVSQETAFSAGSPTPEAVIARDAHDDMPQGGDRDAMLVTLTSFEQ